jgi:hypothetical protein
VATDDRRMKRVILAPRRAGIPERDAIWAYCRARLEEHFPGIPVVEGHHDEGPFNRSAAINLAARLAGDWDVAAVVDADVVVDPRQVEAMFERAEATGLVVWAFQWWAGSTQETADAILSGRQDPDALLAELSAMYERGTANEMGHKPAPDVVPAAYEKVNPISWSCFFAVPRAAFDRLGGFDERFAGWGWEDLAFQSAAAGLIGTDRIGGPLIHLWHPRHPGLGDDGVNKRRNRQLGRRYMYALRALGMHDRPMPADAEEMERDRLNLLSLMEREETDRRKRPAPDLPDWRGWLPTLEELVDSWKAGEPAGPAPLIAFVIRTGGRRETWPARSAYLRETLRTFDAHVDYPRTAARVIFSDWPASVTEELTAIAEAHGFYVWGQAPGTEGHYTSSMQRLWTYLDSRTWAYDQAFIVEDDFAFERHVPLEMMARTLATQPHLVQMALLRDACYQAERDAGGILGHPIDEFALEREGAAAWLEHRRFFTLNPTLIRRATFNEPWPSGMHSEAVFGRRIFRDKSKRSALWGEGEAWIRHLGEVRAGGGY